MAGKLQNSKHPIHRNEGFVCINCGKINPKAEKSCRNHCKFCLYSLHVDKNTPGDRKSPCKGIMEPVRIIKKGKKNRQIVNKCLKCGKIQVNIVARDDDVDAIINIMKKQNLESEI